MILFVVLAVGQSAVATLDVKDCTGKASFTFKQGCFDCWCSNGKSTCSNARDMSPRNNICNWTENDNEEDGIPGKPALRAAEVNPWDLDFPVGTIRGASPYDYHNNGPLGRRVLVASPIPEHPNSAYPQPPHHTGTNGWLRFWSRVLKKGQIKTNSRGLGMETK